MEDAGNPRFVAAHVRDVHARTHAESDSLAGLLLRWAWPGGHEDRFDPIAVDWLRQWGPNGVVTSRDVCSCDAGHCGVCN